LPFLSAFLLRQAVRVVAAAAVEAVLLQPFQPLPALPLLSAGHPLLKVVRAEAAVLRLRRRVLEARLL
jgi:hypothetical protein